MRQLPLEIRLADHARFENFVATGNELLVHQLNHPGAGQGAGQSAGQSAARAARTLWLWGPPQSGRTHLLQACTSAAADRGERVAYLPLHRRFGLPAGMLDGLGELDVVALDDVDAVAGDGAFESAMFRLYEELRRSGGRLIASGGTTPGDAGFLLPDLVSRLKSGGTYRLNPLDDGGRLVALQIRARFRGFDLPDDAGLYLLHHAPRDAASLFGLLDTLDRESLAARKRLTIPFVRSVLALKDEVAG